jgi:hypothetical protein
VQSKVMEAKIEEERCFALLLIDMDIAPALSLKNRIVDSLSAYLVI